MTEQNIQLFGNQRLSIEDIVRVAFNETQVQLNSCETFSGKINSALRFLDTLLKEDGVIYGVTTGYGDSVTVAVPLDLVDELPLHLTRFHGCGLGDVFNKVQGRAILATRLTSLSQGYSGISWEMLPYLKIT